jgi:hypothetical protein
MDHSHSRWTTYGARHLPRGDHIDICLRFAGSEMPQNACPATPADHPGSVGRWQAAPASTDSGRQLHTAPDSALYERRALGDLLARRTEHHCRYAHCRRSGLPVLVPSGPGSGAPLCRRPLRSDRRIGRGPAVARLGQVAAAWRDGAVILALRRSGRSPRTSSAGPRFSPTASRAVE